MTESIPLQSRILRAASNLNEYQVYRAALEWDLTDPIVIESQKDMKSAVRWRDRVNPFNHQVNNLITFCRRLPVTLLADDVGLGKTISAGLIMSELISRARLSKALIVCPKILGPQWKEELDSKFDIPAQVVTGRDLLTANPKGIGAVITTYQSARTYLEKMPADRFQMLVLDEAHKLRNLHGTEKAPQVAVRFRKVLEERRFPFVLMLTATPIQNRLWDLYSLIDLLTVARGHDNPFGSDGLFARKFIADNRDQARKLKPEAAQEFRSIVYGYMSRVRRGDAKLHFPDRHVQLHKVDPTNKELELIAVVGKGIEKLNRLAQISILQALTSSPQALSAQLDNMERNRTIEPEFARDVRTVVKDMSTSAKLLGLGTLIERLKRENPERWRLVIFTSRRETQTTIQLFLEEHGLSVGIINGTSGARNQDTIANFRADPPKCRVIVSTEAGSEGVNLQVANVLVNYDLPWNPMIVEQRIGRVQRLASVHATVGIFNITLRGTFEEYIVGRLMEKLQMSTSAIGDIEALLEGSGVGGGDEEEDGFEEKIRQLVVAALKGADTEASTRMMVESISEAKANLQREEIRLDEMLGEGNTGGYVGPRAPALPSLKRSLSVADLTLQALQNAGAKITPSGTGFLVEDDGGRQHIRFEDNLDGDQRSSLYAFGSSAFSQLVQRLTASGVHAVEDRDVSLRALTEQVARDWVSAFQGKVDTIEIESARHKFEGKALVRARATVAHDSYERLIEIPCGPDPVITFSKQALLPMARNIEHALALGINASGVVDRAARDEALSEFSRFYLERRRQEMSAAGGDARKQKKMEDDFTPRLTFSLVGAEGRLHRDVRARVAFRIRGSELYYCQLVITPSTMTIDLAPPFGRCGITNQNFPDICLGKCTVTGETALRHLLSKSEQSDRLALPEHAVRCELSGKRLISDEVETSSVTGLRVAKHLLKTSAVSGKRAEVGQFGRCAFSHVDALENELLISEISGKRYRFDENERSSVSNKFGHRSEFIECYETRRPLILSETETCAATGHKFRLGILQSCAESGAKVLTSQLETSAVSGLRVRKSLLIKSSVSEAKLLHREAVRSRLGKFCAPVEARSCLWSGKLCHPDDLRQCELTGIEISADFATTATAPRLRPLAQLLEGTAHGMDMQDLWNQIAEHEVAVLGKGRCRVEAAVLSPSGEYLAVSTEIKTMLGLRNRRAGLIFSNKDRTIVGRIAQGTRDRTSWRIAS